MAQAQATTTTERPYSTKSQAMEPRGRPAKGQPTISGATKDDPLVSVQVLKVRQSVWDELARAAAEKKWHRSVLVREILDEWVRGRRKKAGRSKAA